MAHGALPPGWIVADGKRPLTVIGAYECEAFDLPDVSQDWLIAEVLGRLRDDYLLELAVPGA